MMEAPDMDGKDYYQILGVERGAGTSEIRRQYLAMAKQHHPDHEGDTQIMVRLNEAYETLSNPQTRFLYNNQLDDKEVAAAAAGTGAASPAHGSYFYEEARPVYRAAQAAPRRESRRKTGRERPPQKRSFAGKMFSFAAAAVMVIIAGAVIAGHIPTQGVTSALDLTQPSEPAGTGAVSSNATAPDPSASATGAGQSADSTNTSPAASGADPAPSADTNADGTLQPTTPAQKQYRCSLHYIASYKRMNCN